MSRMEEALIFDGKNYISSKRAAEITGYAKDYVGQLCRGGKIDARRIGRNWFVAEDSILEHKEAVTEQLEETYAQMRSGADQQTVKSSVVVSTESDEKSEEDTTLSSTRVRPPVPLSEFAKTRLPTPSEVARHYNSKKVLASMNVTYDDASTLYFEDDRPLNPHPDRSTAYYGEAPITHVIQQKETVGAIHNAVPKQKEDVLHARNDTSYNGTERVPSQQVPIRKNSAQAREPQSSKPVQEVHRKRRTIETAGVIGRTARERRPSRKQRIPRQHTGTTSRLQYVAAVVFFLVIAFGTYVLLGADFVTRVDMNTAEVQSGASSNELRFRDIF